MALTKWSCCKHSERAICSVAGLTCTQQQLKCTQKCCKGQPGRQANQVSSVTLNYRTLCLQSHLKQHLLTVVIICICLHYWYIILGVTTVINVSSVGLYSLRI